MASIFQSKWFRRCRTTFRWTRITLWFIIFLVVAAVAYLHLIGLPDFAKRRLLGELRAHGFEADFTGARLGWGPDIVIENAAFRRIGQPLGPRLSAGQTQIYLNLPGLIHRAVRVDSLSVSQGRLELPFSETNGDFLTVNNVSLDVSLLTNDTIRVDPGRADFHGIQVSIKGAVTNFIASRDWKLLSSSTTTNRQPPTTPVGSVPPKNFLGKLAATLDKIHFAAAPTLEVTLNADGRDADTLRADLSLDAPEAETPWGQAMGLKLVLDLSHPLNPGSQVFARARISATTLTTPQAQGNDMYLTVDLSRTPETNFDAAMVFAANRIKSAWAPPGQSNNLAARRLQLGGHVILRPGDWTIASVTEDVRALDAVTPWGSSASANGKLTIKAAPGFDGADASWGLWERLNHWDVDWRADLTKVASPTIQLDSIGFSSRWRSPALVVEDLDGALYGGTMKAGAQLNVATRALNGKADFDFDIQQVARLLGSDIQQWISQFGWEHPPKISGEARVILPAWTNNRPDWNHEVLPSLWLGGDFSMGAASFRGASVDSAQAHFSYSNRVWDVSQLHATRPEGDLNLEYYGDENTHEFRFTGDAAVNPKDARSFLPAAQQSLMDEVVFSEPPKIHANIKGRWKEPKSIGITADLTATNFTAHGERIDKFAARLDFTNLVMRLADVGVFRDGGELSIPSAEVDWNVKKISVSNLVSTLDVRLVTNVLGSHTPKWLLAIGFETPPTIRVNGSFVVGDKAATDLHFAVTGHDFRWTTLKAEEASGNVDWTGKIISLTNVQARLYSGTLAGWTLFDDTPAKGTDIRGQAIIKDVQLPLLVRSFNSKSNHLEGLLNANLTMSRGNTADEKSWNGHGNVFVREALLWDVKIFGMFSPFLNQIVPGSGSSRAYQASADFVVTNAALTTDNLQIWSTGFRLIYRGSLDANKKLDAKAEALILRNTPVFGPIFSWVFTPLSKLLELKIGGTLSAPTYKSLYMPTALKSLFHPFQTLKSFLPPDEPKTTSPDNTNTSTNSNPKSIK